ncbi:MAG: IS200/IS605 family transposase [Bacteroidales bacterium]|nr:IS200/IS605 family transposase [Bacteroidales bacterium]
MANTFSQIYIQIVFAVKGRLNLVPQNHKEELQKYITGIITKRKQKLLAINCMPDHTHVFVGIKPSCYLPDLVRDIKSVSSGFIKNEKKFLTNFSWQEGYGAFSYSHSQLTNVIQYINNQEKHHKKRTFREEYLELLKKFEVDYDERYLFDWID